MKKKYLEYQQDIIYGSNNALLIFLYFMNIIHDISAYL